MFGGIREQIDTIFKADPAATSWLEVLLCYPGLHAILFHRVAHRLYRWGVPVLPRFISQWGRFLTGIEIHPGASIGRRMFIDHGMGVVIGETAIVGDDVLIYQGVTLGGTGKECGKRHPTVRDRVVIGSGAKVLGNIEIGEDTKIGAGSVVVKSVPANSTVVGVPGRVVDRRQEPDRLQHGRLPDPEGQAIDELARKVKRLERELQALREGLGTPSSER
jgi:serine O-acetyltransferase